MSTQVRYRGSSAEDHENFTGVGREITVDTTDHTLRVHDGQTPGGHPLAKRSDLDASLVTKTATFSVDGNFARRTVLCDGAITANLVAAATLGAGFWCEFVAFSDVLTIDADGAETISGQGSLELQPGNAVRLVCTGTGFVAITMSPQSAPSQQSVCAAKITNDGSVALVSAFNIAAVNRNGTGSVTVTFANDIPVTAFFSATPRSSGCTAVVVTSGTNSCQIITRNGVNANADVDFDLIAFA